MVPVEIRTKRFVHTLFRSRIKRQVPQSWSELSAKQLLSIIQLLHMPLPLVVIKYRIVSVLIRLSTKKMHSWFTHVQAAQLFYLTDFILKDNQNVLTRQLLPVVKVPFFSIDLEPFKIRFGKRVKLFGPSDGLKNIIYDELIFADGLFQQYFQSKKIEDLNKFVSVLYRPGRTDNKETGDLREEFNKHTIEKRAEIVARLPIAYKLAIFFFYQGCRKTFIARYPDLFEGGESEAKPVNTWLEMARHIPNDKFGTIEHIMTLNAPFVLMHLNGTIKDAKEAEKYLK
ncbi:hypothetical protein [Xanthocytophaga flava]|uniref:hypothetical protein n=1 Tax=Xanthocytophaga flava TaxID=3048013 RepID=UPI0028D453B4|nr:hypothetical protein [Xanthocytophaga flavus]MDJ1472833.1 hypothetical protein [Xanthocytophaga flavus]